jgi:hypothetical protein
MYAVRSTDYPECEGRDVQVWPAREKFRTALSQRLSGMIEQGELPPGLYPSLEEVQSKFSAHCRIQIEAADRQPGTFDYAVIIEVSLAAAQAERFAAIRIGKLLPESRL